jgi:primosomal protein N' (replication factor Y) (superfamily II helicase)
VYQTRPAWQADFGPRLRPCTIAPTQARARPHAFTATSAVLARRYTMIVQVAVPRPLWTLFDYRVPPGQPIPMPGMRVRVPFGSRELIAIAVAISAPTAEEKPLKELSAVLDTEPLLNADVLELIRWAAAYYHHPPGDAYFTALPVALRGGQPLQGLMQRFWRLLDCDMDVKVAHAPRQQQAIAWLRGAGGWTSHEALLAAGIDGRLLASLQKKGVIEPAGSPPSPLAKVAGPGFALTEEQSNASAAVLGALGRFECLLLDGVTGSGKTEIYLQGIEAVLARGEQALVLIPEIALTPQTLERFTRRFGNAAVYHSGLTERERAQAWQQCRSGAVRVLIGTRSAIFVPFAALGLIVVDEEHDGSFKQQDGFRYSARDLAVKRAQLLHIPLLMGTATPALETLHNAQRGRYRHLRLTSRPGAAKPTVIRLVDIRGLPLEDGLSAPLRGAIGATLAQGNQVLLFINRRGYAPSYLCTRCGWCAGCPRCESRLTLHQTPPGLRCHHCGFAPPLPARCPDCGHAALRAVGIGTQRGEAGIARAFPAVPLLRIDRDTTRSAARMASHLEMIGRGEPAVLVGTQMLAKGHHFPRVTLVGVLNADAGFSNADFRAPEHTAQLIIQVAGRAGRAERPGEVWIQTYNPNNPLLEALVEHGYEGFAAAELRHRVAARLPPLRAMALLKAEGAEMERTMACLATLSDCVRTSPVEVLGPIAAPLAKRARRFRCQTIVLADGRGGLGNALDELIRVHGQSRFPGVRWSIDVDPYDMF